MTHLLRTFTTAIYIISAAILVSGCGNSTRQSSCLTYTELNDPTSDTLSDWSNVAPGLHATFGTTDLRYPKSVVPVAEQKNKIRLTGWKNERLSAQLVLWSGEEIKGVNCHFSGFSGEGGKLPADIAQSRFVRYVMTDIYGPGCGYRKPEDFPASLSADMLDPLECFDIPAKSVRPVWISIHIPENAGAGTYNSTLTVQSGNGKEKKLEIELEVQDQTLPPPSEWSYHLDLWQHPSAVARVGQLEVWSDAHFEALKPIMKMLADAGQKVITATLNKEPWNNQTYDPYADMITWVKESDGSWHYDFSVFDRWISFMLELGINKMINCYSIVPWNNELHYLDAASGEYVNVKADPGTPVFEEIWTPFLLAFQEHLREKGWLSITNIGMDERSPESMMATMKLLEEVAPELGISLADNHKSYRQYPYIKDISVSASAKVDPEEINARREKGLVTTFYVCCSHHFPNVFTFSPPAEAVYLAWYALAAGYDGSLRWAYNSWVEHPLTDSRFRTWPAGDTYIVYPGARSSIRFERLIEGIQDVEKIRILQKSLQLSSKTDAPERLKQLETVISSFNTINPEKPIEEMLRIAKETIHELSAL